MDTPEKLRTFKFNFWKDGFWAWIIALPFGLICWAVPFVLFFGLLNMDNSPGWFPYFGFIFTGIPAYWVGLIFVYSLMEGITTKVTIADNWVSIRLPWLVFPIFSITRRIDLENIHRINLFAPYGSRIAVYLYFYKNNRERYFYLPRFKNNPPYMEEILSIQKRVETVYPTVEGNISLYAESVKEKDDPLLQNRGAPFSGRPIFIHRIIQTLFGFVFFGIIGVSAWITSSVPPGGIDALSIGLTMGFFFAWFGMLGMFPVIGQVLFWFFGRWVIGAVSWFFFQFSPEKFYWETPEVVNKLLAQFQLQPIRATFADFLFWSILVFSIIISLDNGIGWLTRQLFKRQKST
jgi:hypothetical protein